MNRRAFLGALLGAGAVAVADPERLLWVPGKKLISIPKPGPQYYASAQYIVEKALRLIGATWPPGPPSRPESEWALNRLNSMLSDWNHRDLEIAGRGFQEAATYSLAGELAPYYVARLDPMLSRMAMTSTENLRRLGRGRRR